MATSPLSWLGRQLAREKRAEVRATGASRVRAGARLCELGIEADDVQGLVLRGYGKLALASYVFVRFTDRRAALAWLARMLPEIGRGVPAAEGHTLHIAFTASGLRALGLDDATLEGFSRTFLEGMVGPQRNRFLGDVGESAPEHWAWGGPNTPEVHAVLMLFSATPQAHAALSVRMAEERRAAGVETLYVKDAGALERHEHFGFADGISQPAIDGYHPSASDLHRVRAGEFLLGYENEYGQYTERPLVPADRDPFARLPLDVERSSRHDLGRNGTYLAIRQLGQDVARFRAALDQLASDAGRVDPARRALLGARMVGRWPNGAPLALAPAGEEATLAAENEFRYHRDDRDGLRCPIGAHVRRANPRDSLDPKPGTERSLAVNRRHRIIRRGRSYGPPLPEGAGDDVARGLMFIAVNANLTRQFEFIQHSWLNDARFNGFSEAADPLLSALPSNVFDVPGVPTRQRYEGLPRFVTVEGGAYFFLPGLRALRFLSELSP